MQFSLICTVYNREKYLAQAIKSVLAQSHKSWELIIWDDGSTDNSRAIAQSYAAKDGRIYCGGTPGNNGHAMALRNAIHAAQGQWFGQVDSDDWLDPQALAIAAAHLDDANCGLIYTSRTLVDAEGRSLGEQSSPSPDQIRQFDLCAKVPFHLQLYRRDLFDRTPGVDITLKAAIGYDLALKMLEVEGLGMAQINHPLYFHRIHPDRITANIDLQTIEALRATRKAIARRGLDMQANLMWQLKRG